MNAADAAETLRAAAQTLRTYPDVGRDGLALAGRFTTTAALVEDGDDDPAIALLLCVAEGVLKSHGPTSSGGAQ